MKVQRFDNFMSGPATARKPGGKVHPVLAGLRNRAQRTLSAVRDNITTADTSADPESYAMTETHEQTARRIHAAACPTIALGKKPLDPANAKTAERSWRAYHASHVAEMSALGLSADELVSFLRLELAEVTR